MCFRSRMRFTVRAFLCALYINLHTFEIKFVRDSTPHVQLWGFVRGKRRGYSISALVSRDTHMPADLFPLYSALHRLIKFKKRLPQVAIEYVLTLQSLPS